jgi:hypothetical protein
MIAYILYNKNSPMEREVEHFMAQLERLRVNAKQIEADSLEGTHMTELYELMARPSAVLVRDDGSVVERWQHGLPSPEDISHLSHT